MLTELLDPADRPDHVVGFLWDGTNANVLYDMVAAGEAPNVARLLAMGTGLGHGAMSSLPTVTLANHTTILTGAHPGHHGILHNAWYDRATGEQVVTNSPATWPWAMQTLSPEVETLYQAVHRAFPGARTVSVNEPCDTGADQSTFEVLRTGGDLVRPPKAEDLPFATERFVRPEKSYQVSSRIDHTGMVQALDVWDGARDGRSPDGAPLPLFTFVNFTLTDAAFHAGGPYSDIARASVHDTDARLGQILDAVERSGAFDRTAFFLVADHGMEDSNPEVTGDWAPALVESGVPVPRRGLRLRLRRRVSRRPRFPQQFRGSGPPKLLWKTWDGATGSRDPRSGDRGVEVGPVGLGGAVADGSEVVEAGQILGRQRDIDGPDVLLEVGAALGAGDRHHVVALGGQPGEGDLARGHAVGLGDLAHHGHEGQVVVEVVALEPGHGAPEVVVGQLVEAAHGPREQAPARAGCTARGRCRARGTPGRSRPRCRG